MISFFWGSERAVNVPPPNTVCTSCPATVNVLVPNCKIYNDASCDMSADGQLLAVFIPSSQRGFPDEGILAVYSLAAHNLGEMLYSKRFGSFQLHCLQIPKRKIQSVKPKKNKSNSLLK